MGRDEPAAGRYRAITWTDPRAEGRPSPIHGRGLFARAPIRRGEAVSVVGGEPMTGEEFGRFAAAACRYNAVRIGEDLNLVEPLEVTAAEEGSLNLSCDPNLWMADEVTLVSRADIAAGEELTVDYALFTADPGWALDPCGCGSSLCRGRVTGEDWRLPRLQERYRGRFSPFLNRRIARAAGRGEGER